MIKNRKLTIDRLGKGVTRLVQETTDGELYYIEASYDPLNNCWCIARSHNCIVDVIPWEDEDEHIKSF